MVLKIPARYGLCLMLVVGSIYQVVNCSEEQDDKDEGLDSEAEAEEFGVQSLIDFKRMINCATGRSSLYYIKYGCYCGLGGRGKPVDATDRCCKAHDDCYTRAKKSSGCGTLQVYYLPYKRSGCTGCSSISSYGSDRNARCKYALCQCDGEAAKCFARNRSSYNMGYYLYPRWRCWLG
ncbi:acidic phospholipase A2-like [Ptychodera flava]|uniref:acidic phospholipase A2-like n=1 Tax=Ptychodera flava TaxID=63121 RepID=UPI003969DFF4